MRPLQTDNRPAILIIDDERANIKILNDILKDEYRVIGAINGQQALKAASLPYPPNLILLDILMPDMDGYAVCRELKKNFLTRDIPVIFFTAMDNEEDEAKGFEAGAVDYIHKPARKAIVLARVKIHLELKRQRDFHANLSSLDGLTGIPNRRRFDEYIQLELQRAKRNSRPLALAMLDIDYFKLYNDHYGHVQGDDCLKKIASALHGCMHRSHDFVARYGGEEFACLLPDTNEEGAQNVTSTMLEAVRELQIPHEFSEASNTVTVSIGCFCLNPPQNYLVRTFINAADQLLYISKDAGRNRTTLRTGDHAQI